MYQNTSRPQPPFSLPYNQIQDPGSQAPVSNADFTFGAQAQGGLPAFNFDGTGPGQSSQAPQSSQDGVFDFSFGGSYQYGPSVPIPKPWWEVDGGARNMVFPLEVEPYEPILLANNSIGPGFPFRSQVWEQQMDGIGAPVPDISLPNYNPTPGEVDRQRQFDLQQVQNQQSYQPQPHYQQQQAHSQQPGGLVHSPESQSSSFGIRAVSESPSGDLSEDSSAAPLRRSNHPWGLTDDLKPVSQLVHPQKPHHKTIKDTAIVGGLGASADEGQIDESLVVHSTDEQPGPFPPGLSLARTSAAAHSVVRLEVSQAR